MKRALPAILLIVAACSSPPAPVVAPSPAPAPAAAQNLGSGRVTATALNVRAEPSADTDALTTVRKNDVLTLIEERDGWYRVRLASGQTGWVSARYISRGGKPPAPRPRRAGCPADSDFAFEKSPLPAFTENGRHGLVVVDASVNTAGTVTSTKVVSNTTGDAALATMAEREIRSAKFIAPVRNCVKRAFIFTYKRAF